MQLEDGGGQQSGFPTPGSGAARSQGQDPTILTAAPSCPQAETPRVCRELHWAASPGSDWEEWKRCRGATPGGGIPCSEGRSLQAGAPPRPASPDSTRSDFQPHSPAVRPGRAQLPAAGSALGAFFPQNQLPGSPGGWVCSPSAGFPPTPSFVFLGQEQGGAAAGG